MRNEEKTEKTEKKRLIDFMKKSVYRKTNKGVKQLLKHITHSLRSGVSGQLTPHQIKSLELNVDLINNVLDRHSQKLSSTTIKELNDTKRLAVNLLKLEVEKLSNDLDRLNKSFDRNGSLTNDQHKELKEILSTISSITTDILPEDLRDEIIAAREACKNTLNKVITANKKKILSHRLDQADLLVLQHNIAIDLSSEQKDQLKELLRELDQEALPPELEERYNASKERLNNTISSIELSDPTVQKQNKISDIINKIERREEFTGLDLKKLEDTIDSIDSILKYNSHSLNPDAKSDFQKQKAGLEKALEKGNKILEERRKSKKTTTQRVESKVSTERKVDRRPPLPSYKELMAAMAAEKAPPNYEEVIGSPSPRREGTIIPEPPAGVAPSVPKAPAQELLDSITTNRNQMRNDQLPLDVRTKAAETVVEKIDELRTKHPQVYRQHQKKLESTKRSVDTAKIRIRVQQLKEALEGVTSLNNDALQKATELHQIINDQSSSRLFDADYKAECRIAANDVFEKVDTAIRNRMDTVSNKTASGPDRLKAAKEAEALLKSIPEGYGSDIGPHEKGLYEKQIDEIVTADPKLFELYEKVMNTKLPLEERADAAIELRSKLDKTPGGIIHKRTRDTYEEKAKEFQNGLKEKAHKLLKNAENPQLSIKDRTAAATTVQGMLFRLPDDIMSKEDKRAMNDKAMNVNNNLAAGRRTLEGTRRRTTAQERSTQRKPTQKRGQGI